MNQKEAILWKVTLANALLGDSEAQEHLRTENRIRKDDNLPSIEEELLAFVRQSKANKNDEMIMEMEPKEEMVLVCLQQESYPEVAMWAVVPKSVWLKTLQTPEELLNLVEKQVAGKTYPESIAEAEKDIFLRAQGVPDNLRKQWRRLKEAMEGASLVVEPANADSEPMTIEELTEAEHILLYS